MAVAPTDQDDWETFTCGGHQYTLPKRYENPSVIGHGAFGAVM